MLFRSPESYISSIWLPCVLEEETARALLLTVLIISQFSAKLLNLGNNSVRNTVIIWLRERENRN